MSDTIIADVTQLRLNTNSADPIEDSKLNNNLIQYPVDNVAFSDFLNLEKINPNMYSLETFKSKMSLKRILFYVILVIVACFFINYIRLYNK